MLEVIIVFLLLLISVYFAFFWLSLVVLVLCFFVIVPAVYAILKGAPFVPSRRTAVKVIVKFASLKKGEKVVDLGAGDGRVLEALYWDEPRARIYGYEFSIFTWFLANLRLKLKKVEGKVYFGNFWNKNFSDSDVVVCFLFEGAMKRIKEEIWPTLKPGTRLISNLFPLPGVDHKDKRDSVYLYIK